MNSGRNIFIIISIVVLFSISCEKSLQESIKIPATEEASSVDSISPDPISGLVAVNAYDGRINLRWDAGTALDFDHYNIYISKSYFADVNGLPAAALISDILTRNYQFTGLDNETVYYFAVTAVDKTDNENTLVKSIMAKPVPTPEGKVDPDLDVGIYISELAWPGTTLLPDNHITGRPRIIEVNMRGEIIWEYILPQNLSRFTNPGFDAELLPDNHILFLLPGNGIYEIDRSGKVVWSYLNPKISHDADRLPDGNTIFVFGGNDRKNDAQVTEVNRSGEIVWSWHAADYFDKAPYSDIFNEGWTHTNAVTRLPNGNTLISPRNFNIIVEVDPAGSIVRTIGEGILKQQHDPEMLPNGNILLANQVIPHRAIELDPEKNTIIWESQGFEKDMTPVRDADRLPNGNTLITGSTGIFEVTSAGETVWQLSLKGIVFSSSKEKPTRGFYKAQRISSPD